MTADAQAGRTTANPEPGKGGRPPLAVVGSQISQDEELFGRVFDRWVVGRLFTYLEPYRRRIVIAVIAVLVFTLTQLTIPLIVRAAIDEALVAGEGGRSLAADAGDRRRSPAAITGQLHAANWTCRRLASVGLTGENVHLRPPARDVRASAGSSRCRSWTRPRSGRMMSRLQGDVNSLQEFLENSIFGAGRSGPAGRHRCGHHAVAQFRGSALLTLSVVPTAADLVRIIWLPRARKCLPAARAKPIPASNGGAGRGHSRASAPCRPWGARRSTSDPLPARKRARTCWSHLTGRKVRATSWCRSSTRLTGAAHRPSWW